MKLKCKSVKQNGSFFSNSLKKVRRYKADWVPKKWLNFNFFFRPGINATFFLLISKKMYNFCALKHFCGFVM